MCFKQKRAISTFSGELVRFVDKFTYLGSNILSTEKDVNIRQAKTLTVIGRLSIIQNSDVSDEIKRDFFKAVAVSILLYGCTTLTLTNARGKI